MKSSPVRRRVNNTETQLYKTTKKSAKNSEILIWNVNKSLYKGIGRPLSEKKRAEKVQKGG